MARIQTLFVQEEGVIRETEEERSLLRDLEDGVFDGGRMGVGERVEIERNDRDSIGELL